MPSDDEYNDEAQSLKLWPVQTLTDKHPEAARRRHLAQWERTRSQRREMLARSPSASPQRHLGGVSSPPRQAAPPTHPHSDSDATSASEARADAATEERSPPSGSTDGPTSTPAIDPPMTLGAGIAGGEPDLPVPSEQVSTPPPEEAIAEGSVPLSPQAGPTQPIIAAGVSAQDEEEPSGAPSVPEMSVAAQPPVLSPVPDQEGEEDTVDRSVGNLPELEPSSGEGGAPPASTSASTEDIGAGNPPEVESSGSGEGGAPPAATTPASDRPSNLEDCRQRVRETQMAEAGDEERLQPAGRAATPTVGEEEPEEQGTASDGHAADQPSGDASIPEEHPVAESRSQDSQDIAPPAAIAAAPLDPPAPAPAPIPVPAPAPMDLDDVEMAEQGEDTAVAPEGSVGGVEEEEDVTMGEAPPEGEEEDLSAAPGGPLPQQAGPADVEMTEAPAQPSPQAAPQQQLQQQQTPQPAPAPAPPHPTHPQQQQQQQAQHQPIFNLEEIFRPAPVPAAANPPPPPPPPPPISRPPPSGPADDPTRTSSLQWAPENLPPGTQFLTVRGPSPPRPIVAPPSAAASSSTTTGNPPIALPLAPRRTFPEPVAPVPPPPAPPATQQQPPQDPAARVAQLKSKLFVSSRKDDGAGSTKAKIEARKRRLARQGGGGGGEGSSGGGEPMQE